MGPYSDPMAVVDQYCRVHALEGLRVVDTSVMPELVRAVTNATAIMIAERVADWIIEGRWLGDGMGAPSRIRGMEYPDQNAAITKLGKGGPRLVPSVVRHFLKTLHWHQRRVVPAIPRIEHGSAVKPTTEFRHILSMPSWPKID